MRDLVVPNGWNELPLTELAHYRNGHAFKPDELSVEGTPVIRIEQLNNPTGSYDYFAGPIPADIAIEDGDLIFSWSATLKVVLWRHGQGVLNQHLFKVLPKPGLDKRFIFYVLDYHMEAIGEGSHGSTMKHIKRGELQRYRVAVPPSHTQQRIAEILSTVDEAIEQTEALIAKTQQIKAGLMHDLFTRGVTPDGQLRPSREESPHLYKESPLGWIPLEWRAALVDSLLAKIEQGWSPDCLSMAAEGNEWGVLKTSAVQWSGFYSEHNKRLPAHLDPKPRLAIRENDVLMTRAGPNSRVGVTALVDVKPGLLMLSDKLYRLVPQPSIKAPFLALALSSEPTQRHLSQFKTGLAESQTNISQRIVRRLLLPLPEAAERQAIVVHMLALQKCTRVHETELSKLRAAKAGLMHDLLTGVTSIGVHE